MKGIASIQRIEEDLSFLDELVPEWVIEDVESSGYEFGYAIVYEDFAVLCTPSGYRYETVDF